MTTSDIWDKRYRNNGNSGLGTHNQLLHDFKISYLNKVISENNITSVYDLGCGDGHQMTKLYTHGVDYTGTDISRVAIDMCRKKYTDKRYVYYDEYIGEGDINVSFDVIYHILDDREYRTYLDRLFKSRYVLIYSSNHKSVKKGHVVHREFLLDVPSTHELVEKVENPHRNISSADLYLFKIKNIHS
jgi:SAM-dependent methyltransferase